MRKSLLYMIGKNTPCILLILLLIASTTPSASAQLPYLSLNPMQYTVPQPGQSFTIDVNITGVTDLLGPEFRLWYNTTALNATGVTLGDVAPNPMVKGPVGPAPGYYWSPHNFTDPFNATERGCVWVVLVNPLGQAFTGNGTIATVNFTAKVVGNSTLHLNETVLGDSMGNPIAHTIEPSGLVQGTIEVIPEFPAAIIMPLLLIATLAAAIIGKMLWSRKRRDALIAK